MCTPRIVKTTAFQYSGHEGTGDCDLRAHYFRRPVHCAAMNLTKWEPIQLGILLSVQATPSQNTQRTKAVNTWRPAELLNQFDFLRAGLSFRNTGC